MKRRVQLLTAWCTEMRQLIDQKKTGNLTEATQYCDSYIINTGDEG